MSNIKSLDDLNGGGSDDEKGKYNEYYAGGEKRWVCCHRCAGRTRS